MEMYIQQLKRILQNFPCHWNHNSIDVTLEERRKFQRARSFIKNFTHNRSNIVVLQQIIRKQSFYRWEFPASVQFGVLKEKNNSNQDAAND